MINIEPLTYKDWTTTMELAVRHVPKAERPAYLTNCLNLLTNGVIDPDAIRIARRQDGAIVGMQVCVPLAGASCLFWLPAGQDDCADALVQACLSISRERGCKIAQAFVATADIARVQPLLRQGFRRITQMHQLRLTLSKLPPSMPSELRFETFRTTGYHDFAATLQRTYEGTLDCPELNDKRTIAEIIAGHQAEGNFDPDRWWLAYLANQAIGVALAVELKDATWDLAYLGIVPEHRRQGHGRTLLRHVVHGARDQGATHMIVAVDGRNTPAQQLYQAAGFIEMDRCEVLLNFLNQRE
jgi:mycothiol synthase